MTIQRGVAWGEPGPLPDDGVVARSDAEAAAAVIGARLAGEPVPPIGLVGGDLCRTVGGRGDAARLRSPEAQRLPVDLGVAVLDGRERPFVAHLVVRHRFWRGRVVAVMNAQHLGRFDVAPRAHPNDGRLDVLDARLSVRDRVRAARRLPLGTHVPHPGIAQHRVGSWSTVFEPPAMAYADGRLVGTVRDVAVRVEPDALLVVV